MVLLSVGHQTAVLGNSGDGPGLLSLFALECLVRLEYYESLYVLLATPAGLTLLLLLPYGLQRWRHQARAAKSRATEEESSAHLGHLNAKLFYAVTFVWYLFYFQLSAQLLGVFSCTLADGGRAYLNAYPWVQCRPLERDYAGVLGVAGVFLLLYVLGIPALLFVPLWRRRRTLGEPAVQQSLGHLYGCYVAKFWYWEALVLARRLLVAGLVALLPFDRPAQIELALFGVLLFFLLLQVFFQPFASRLENALECASLFSILFSFLTNVIAPELDFLPVLLLNLLVFLAMLGFLIRYLERLCPARC